MKKSMLLPLMMVVFSSSIFAQRMKLTNGNLSPLAKETSIQVEFTYDNMKVGKFDKEEEYVKKKKEEYNQKEAGRGDSWALSWVNDLYASRSTTAKYTLIVHTIFTEPGWNVGVMRANAQINAVATIVETADHSRKIAEITIDKALGRDFWGADFDTGMRIQEAYADAGKELGKFIKNKID